MRRRLWLRLLLRAVGIGCPVAVRQGVGSSSGTVGKAGQVVGIAVVALAFPSEFIRKVQPAGSCVVAGWGRCSPKLNLRFLFGLSLILIDGRGRNRCTLPIPAIGVIGGGGHGKRLVPSSLRVLHG